MSVVRRKSSTTQPVCKLFKTSLKYQTKNYLINSTLHGVRFIADNERPTFEKIVWSFLVITGAISAIVIILSLWEKFLTSPTITGLDTDFHSWHVPFPGVTVCPENKASSQRINDYINKRWSDKNLTDIKKKYYYNFINLLSNLSYTNLNEIDRYNNDKTLPQQNLRDVVFSVVKHSDELITSCEWKGKQYHCSERFLPTFTEQGICYSFNTLMAETTWPWRNNTELITLKTDYIYETDALWSILIDGDSRKNPYSIYIHSSEELPSVEMSPQHVWNKVVSRVYFAAKTTYTTEESRQLSSRQRKCIFHDEAKLATAAAYSYWACMSDCRMRYARKMCSCVPFFYHQVGGFPYCDLNGLICLSKYADELKNPANCHCVLPCMNTVYEVQKLVDSKKGKNSPLIIGFLTWPMVRYKREVIFGWVDLLVAFGGIAGLFLGFSLLSAVEIIYYFTMRTTYMLYKERDKLDQILETEENLELRKINNRQKSAGVQRTLLNQPFMINTKQDRFILPYLD